MKLNRFLRPRSIRANRRLACSAIAARPAIESLEERQLMSLTVAIRTSSGASTATASSVGQVIDCEVLATITGNEPGSNDGLDTVTGSILGTETSSANSVAGDLTALVPAEFRGNSAESGTYQDLNGDGNIDVGSNNNADFDGFFSARAGGIAQDGTVSGNSMTFDIGFVTYTVKSLHSGAATDVYFRFAGLTTVGGNDAIWVQDGLSYTDANAIVSSASPLVITGSNVTPPTATASISGSVNQISKGVTSALSGVTVTATNSSGLNFSTVDNYNGTYSFANLPAGNYDITQSVPVGYTQTSPTSSQIAVTLGNGQNATGENFTDTQGTTTTGSIAGTVSKVVSGVTSGFSGVTVSLTDSGGLDITTPTSSTGTYSFTGLPAGTYDVSESVPSGYTKTSPTSSQIAVTLASGQNATGENFTDTQNTTTTTGSIAGTVSKLVGGVTSGFSGVTVSLTDSGGLDITTPTSSTGTYSFTGLPAGTYDVSESVPSGYTQTSPDTAQIAVNLSSGQNATGENFTDTANTTTQTPLTGTVIGTSGSFQNDGNTIAKAFDGNLATFYDGASASGDWAGLNLGSEYTITSVSYSPRSGWAGRMVGGIFQGSNDPNFVTGVVNLATITATPATGVYSTLSVSSTAAFEYVRYLSPANSYGDVAELQFFGTAAKITGPTPLSGSVIGTSGSFQNDGNTIAKAFDGNLSTFFDGPTANGNYAGLNLGSQYNITSISYAPRSGWASRMVGGIFQGSNSATFASGVVNLATITATPVVGSLTSITITNAGSFQYVRYLSPTGSYGDVAEIEFFGTAAKITGPTPLSGSVIGTSGSFQNDGNTIAKAFDGNLSTFFDGPTANGNYAGLNLGSQYNITSISYAPRSGWASRMVGGIFQGSNSATFASGVVNLATITATPVVGSLTSITITNAGSFQYVRYLSPTGSYGDVAEIEFFGTPATNTTTQLSGSVIGTSGSFQNDGNTIANAFDGNLSTFFDGPVANGNWAGLNLGSAQNITQISYAPRANWAARMVGGIFQASSTADFSSGVVNLYTISATPAYNTLTTVSVNVTGTYQYVRYLSPSGSYGDVAEIQFFT